MANAKTTTKRTAKPAAKKADATASIVNEDAFKMAEDFTSAAREQFENAFSHMNGVSEEWREAAEDVAEEIRARVEKHQEVASELGQQVVEAARTEMSDAVQFANELTSAKTFADALEIQQSYFTSLFETRMERSKTMTEKSVEVARDAMAPVATDMSSLFNAKAFETLFRFPTRA